MGNTFIFDAETRSFASVELTPEQRKKRNKKRALIAAGVGGAAALGGGALLLTRTKKGRAILQAVSDSARKHGSKIAKLFKKKDKNMSDVELTPEERKKRNRKRALIAGGAAAALGAGAAGLYFGKNKAGDRYGKVLWNKAGGLFKRGAKAAADKAQETVAQ
nr:MAG TPA: hypothetical protein [Bacteriophage sp.]